MVGVKDGRITLVDKSRPTQAGKIIDAIGCLVLPGLVNTHTHLPMVCFRGMADDLPLMDWLTNHIFPAEARFVNTNFGGRIGVKSLPLTFRFEGCR